MKYVNDVMQIFDDFGLASGSKLNKQKTIGLITNARNINSRDDFLLTLGPECVLGVPLGKNKNRDKYWEETIHKMQNKILPWKMRDLSMRGKIHIVKSLGLSMIYYGCEMITIKDLHVKI